MPELVPIRHGRMLVSPFTFFRGAALIMASDLSTTARTGFSVQCCGDAHLLELRGLRLARTPDASSTSTTSTRPCPGRGSGTSSGWPPASRWPAGTWVSARPTAGRSCGRRPASTGRPCWPPPPGRTLEAWYAHLEVSRLMEWIADEVAAKRLGKKEAAEAGQGRGQGPDQGQPAGVHQVHRPGRRRPADHRRPPAGRAGRGPAPGRGGGGHRAPDGRADRRLPQEPAARAPPGRRVPLRPHGPQGGRGGQRGHPLLDRCCSSAGTPTTRCSSRSRRPSPRCSSVTWAAGRRPTTASGWWPASASCRRPPTSSWAGSGSPTSTASPATTTCASSTTGRARPTWTRMRVPGPPCSTPGSAVPPWPGPMPGRATARHRLLPGPGRRLRPGHRRLLGRLRRPERAGLRGHGARGQGRADPRRARAVGRVTGGRAGNDGPVPARQLSGISETKGRR